MRFTRALMLVCVFVVPADRLSAQSTAVAIENVSVISMARPGVLPGQTVTIRGRRILDVVPRQKARVSKTATRIDGTGKYLIPGLLDSHVHLQQDESINRDLLTLFLVNGVTGVVSLHGNPAHLALRDAVRRGAILGPKIFTSGPWVGTPHGQPPGATPQEIERQVAAQKQAGYDFIKLHGDLSLEAYRRLMAASRQHNIRVIGHAPRNLGVAPMFEERQQAVAHAEEYLYAYFYYGVRSQGQIPELDAKIATLAASTAKAGTSVISTLEVYRGIADQISDLGRVLGRREVAYLPRSLGDLWGWWPSVNSYTRRFGKDQIPLFRANYAALEQLVTGFHRAGVPILAGTDTPTSAVVPGFSLHDELRALVNAGLTPFQALQTATVHPARFLGIASENGTIERGKIADCVLLNRNPLEDITATTAISGVLRNGRWISAEQIQAALNRLQR